MAFNFSRPTNNFGALWYNVIKVIRPPGLPKLTTKLRVESSCSKAMGEGMTDFVATGFSVAERNQLLQPAPKRSGTSLTGMAQGLTQFGVPTASTGAMQKRGFKNMRFNARKEMKAAAEYDKSFKREFEKFHHKPHIQRQMLESYLHGIEYSMRTLKESGFAHDSVSVHLKRAILFGVAAILYYGMYTIMSTVKEVKGVITEIDTGLPSKNKASPSRGDRFEVTEHVDVTFDDVKGCDEAKKELKDVVEFLRNPERFSKMGARLPKGVLVSGRPGTGKTLLARAVAGEAHVPFLCASGSEFDEIFVGVGSLRIRQLFAEAKARAPCVVFIDEIDAVISRRTNSPTHPYANQTINQLLAEMDGFKSSTGIIVIGATNQRKVLDTAAVRPGRFDIEIHVREPDIRGRKALLDLYLRKVKHRDVDMEAVARGTVGFTGADIANLVNQAAILACLEHEPVMTMTHLWKARDKIIYGSSSSKPHDPEVNRISAYHEAGHALVSFYSPNRKSKIHKITMIPHGDSLASVSFLPEKDNENESYNSLLANLDSLMGGRVAEELLLGLENVTTGPVSDLQKATKIAESIVTNFGMSESVGLRCFEKVEDASEKCRQSIDEEVKRLLTESHARALKILTDHSKEHKLLAEALLKYETLTLEDMTDIINGRKPNVAVEFEKEMKEQEQVNIARRFRSKFGLFEDPGKSGDHKNKPPPSDY